MSIAIKVENLSKAYQLGEIGTGTISHDLERWLAKVRGKEDPFLIVGETNDREIAGTSDIVWSLKDLSFEIEQGQAVGIIGKNGAGKSTLLKLLSKVTSPTLGKISGYGRIASLLEVGTGFHPELTGRENIYLNGAILGMRKKEINRKFDEIVDFSGVERYIDTPVKRYSSGMYVRLAFAVAAHLESEILIVDEVLAVGDAEFQKKCIGKMDDVSKGEGRTILFVSHNMSAVRSLCSNSILLEKGMLKEFGKSNEIISRYNENLKEVKFFDKSELDNTNNRRGSGDVRFSSIIIKNLSGNETDTFEEGEDIYFSCSIVIHNNPGVMDFWLGIRSPNLGEFISSTSKISLNNELQNGKKSIDISFKLNAPNFRIGEFPLYFWLGQGESLAYDVVDGIFHLNIVNRKSETEEIEDKDDLAGYFSLDFTY